MPNFKCYYHPKAEGEQLCRGCKLPICRDCMREAGFCPECTQKRAAVDQLRARRRETIGTGRLRQAVRKMTGSLVPKAAPPPSGDAAPQRRRYNPDVAYQGPAKGRARSPEPVAETVDTPERKVPVWGLAVGGLGVCLALMVGVFFVKPHLHATPRPASVPHYTELSPEMKAELRRNANVEYVEIETPKAHGAPAARPAERPHAARRVRRAVHHTPRQPSLEEAMKFQREPESAMGGH